MDTAGAALGGSVLGMIAGGIQNQNQMNQQTQLMNLQLKNQKELNKQGNELSYQNWLRTNYSAQRGEMERAGLNVGMMYGMGSGAGGTLTGGSGGSAASGNAPQPNNQMAMLLGDLMANIELKKAQARNLNVNSDKTEGVDTDLTKTQIDNNKIQNSFNTENFETALEKAKADLENVNANTNKQVAEGKLSEIDGVTRNWKNVSDVLNTIMETKQMSENIKQKWAEVKTGWQNALTNIKNAETNRMNANTNQYNANINAINAEINQEKMKIQEFTENIKSEYPNVWSVLGKVINDGVIALESFGGLNKDYYDSKKATNKTTKNTK